VAIRELNRSHSGVTLVLQLNCMLFSAGTSEPTALTYLWLKIPPRSGVPCYTCNLAGLSDKGSTLQQVAFVTEDEM
jgi:hypothetical protein